MAFNYGLRPTTVQMMSSSGTSSQSSAFAAYTYYVRICADADCHIFFLFYKILLCIWGKYR